MVQQDTDSLPFFFYISMLAVVVPMEFFIGDFFMTVSRLVLLVLVPYLFAGLVGGRYGPVNAVDILFFCFLIWFAVAIGYQGRRTFVTFVGSNYMIMLGGYLMGRCWVRGPKAMTQMIVFYGLLVIASMPFAIYEMQTSIMPLARLVDNIPGVMGSEDVEYPSRNELERVQFVFVHPIHYGLFSTYIFGLIVIGLKGTCSLFTRMLWGAGIMFCCFTSGSSGPFLGVLIVVVLILYRIITRGNWKLLLWGSVVLYIILDIFSTRPAYFAIIERLAFNPGTAFGRRLILEAGVEQIQRTPIFGIHGSLPLPHWMTGSLDNHWLLVAVAYGMPAFLALTSAYVIALVRAGRADFRDDPKKAALRQGWIIGMVGAIFSLATVAVWSEIMTLTYLMLGAGIWFLDEKRMPKKGEEDTFESDKEAAEGTAEGAEGVVATGPPVPDDNRDVYTRFPVKSRGEPRGG